MISPLFKARNISKTIQGTTILKNVSIEVHTGELKALIGPSGSGKSTFLQCMNCIITPDSGELFLAGKKLDITTAQNLCYLRKNIGMVFQDFNLFEHLSVEENVSIALKKVAGYSTKDAQQRAYSELHRVGLEDKLCCYPSQLSGGQKQRVAIARALAMEPKVLLLDEPTSALDPERTGEVLTVIQQLAKSGITMIMATHQIEFARALASEILFMESGQIIEQGKPSLLLEKNSKSRTKFFHNSLNAYLSTIHENSTSMTFTNMLAGDLSHDITGSGTESTLLPRTAQDNKNNA